MGDPATGASRFGGDSNDEEGPPVIDDHIDEGTNPLDGGGGIDDHIDDGFDPRGRDRS